jgi:hypothetical protein
MLGQAGAGDRHLLVEFGLLLLGRDIGAVEPFLHELRPVDVLFAVLLRLGLLGGLAALGLGLLGIRVLDRVVHFLEQRVLHQFLLEDLLQLERRHLQELERLLQARRHDQLGGEPLRETLLHLHERNPRALTG